MKVLIIGLGSIAMKHIAAIKAIDPGGQIFALRSNQQAHETIGVTNIYSISELMFVPDFIIISNPTFLHEEYINVCIKYKCPLFIEKPVLSNLDNAKSLLKDIQDNDIKTYIGCNMRFHPALQFVKNELFLKKQIRINEVNIYFGSYLPEWRPGRDFRNVYSAHKEMGGGVHLDLIHELDYCIWIFGYPESVVSLKECKSTLQIDSVDYAKYQLLYKQFSADITLNYYRRDAKRQLEILTPDDTILVDLIRNKVSSLVTGTIFFEKTFSMADTYLDQMNYFIDHLHVPGKMMNDIEEGIEILKIALHE